MVGGPVGLAHGHMEPIRRSFDYARSFGYTDAEQEVIHGRDPVS